MKKILPFLIGILLALPGSSQSKTSVNLKSTWQVQSQDKFIAYEGQKTKTIHFSLDKKALSSSLVIYSNPSPYSSTENY